ncbi:MAG TPA: hypothetical protein VII44_00530 [Puia sp.]
MEKLIATGTFRNNLLLLLCTFLMSCLAGQVMAQSKTANSTSKNIKKLKKWDKSYEEWEKNMQELNAQRANLDKQLKAYNEQLNKMIKNTSNLDSDYGDLGGSGAISTTSGAAGDQSQLLQATKQMQETQMSFNMQYLQLQNSMQNENRQFTMVSNIMKTKHDTVKNTISNIH